MTYKKADPLNRDYFIYKITNIKNNKIYIGKTYDILNRWRGHVTAARLKIANDYTYFHRAINKWGEENFKIEIISEYMTEKEVLQAEIEYIALYNSMDRRIGYNRTKGGDGITGYKATHAQRIKLSKAKKGKLIGDENPFYGKKHNEKTRKIMSQKAKERAKTEKYIQMNKDQCYFSLEECLKIQKDFYELSYEKLAKKYNTNLSTIHDIIYGKYLNIRGHSILTKETIKSIINNRLKKHPGGKERFSKKEQQEIIKYYLSEKTLSLYAVAKKYKCRKETIIRILNKYNIARHIK